MANTSVFRTFEPEQGLKSSSCMTLGRSSTRFMAAGLPEEQWAEPSTLSHLAMVYHLAPNTVLIVSGAQGGVAALHRDLARSHLQIRPDP